MSDSLKTLFGKIPEDWSVNLVGEVFSLSQGLQISSKKRISEKKDGYIPLLKITDLPHKKFSEFVIDIDNQYIASIDDIIYTRTGNVGYVYTDVEGCVHNNCFKVHFDKKQFDKYYVYYYLKSKEVFIYSNQVASGSVQKDLTHPAFKSCPIGYPNDLKEQYKIGRILKDIDDKIEINNQINQTLEEMVSTLFKEWFENFNFPNNQGKPYKDSGGEMKQSELGEIPIDWTIGTLNNIASFKNGKTSPRRDDSFLIPVFGSNGNIGKTQKFNFENVIIIGRVGSYCGSLYYSLGKCWVTDNAMIGKSKFGFGQFHLLYLLKRLNLNNRSTGSGQPLLNQSILNSIEIVIPVKEYLQKFYNLLEPFFEQIQQNQQQNKILKQQRDALLPKLISGEIRV